MDRQTTMMMDPAIGVEDREEAALDDQSEVREAAVPVVVVVALGAAQAEVQGALQVAAGHRTELLTDLEKRWRHWWELWLTSSDSSTDLTIHKTPKRPSGTEKNALEYRETFQ